MLIRKVGYATLASATAVCTFINRENFDMQAHEVLSTLMALMRGLGSWDGGVV